MKKRTHGLIWIGLILFTALSSCKKEAGNNISNETEVSETKSKNVELQTSFAKILAKTIKSDNDLRNFIKNEGLKEFDRDNDILYHQVKNAEISNGESFRSKLLNFTTEEELATIEKQLPLLTIFLPTLPNFSPNNWDTRAEIPAIAVANLDKAGTVSLYDDKGEEFRLKYGQIPGFPVLVVKENERVIVKKSNNNKLSVKNTGLKLLSSTSGNFSFEFTDKAYDGSLVDKKVTSQESLKANKLSAVKGSISRLAPSPNLSNPNAIDQINVDAYNSGNEWHRDYVYYGITASSPKGKFRNYYSEYITSFKFLTPNALGIISDQDGDPRVNNSYATGPNTGNLPTTMWTDGNFEFRISVLVNAKNGAGNEYVRQMSVRPSELFDLQYELTGELKFIGRKIYGFRNAIPKEFHPNIELIPWDLENYGTAWKFIFYEIDGTVEETKSYENTSTFATNFGFDPSFEAVAKLGLKFGASATTSEKRTYSIKTMLGSDNLAEAILTFDQPVIIGTSNGSYQTREITNGNVLSISVEPRRNNNPIN